MQNNTFNSMIYSTLQISFYLGWYFYGHFNCIVITPCLTLRYCALMDAYGMHPFWFNMFTSEGSTYLIVCRNRRLYGICPIFTQPIPNNRVLPTCSCMLFQTGILNFESSLTLPDAYIYNRQTVFWAIPIQDNYKKHLITNISIEQSEYQLYSGPVDNLD